MIRLKDILGLIGGKPFRPFRIHVSDGSSHEVRHPELISANANLVVLFDPVGSLGSDAFDDSQTISMLHISRLELIGNESRKKND